MRFTKTQAYEHRAKLNRTGENDITEKFHIILILREKFGLHGLTGEVVKIDEESYRLPDILIKGTKPIIIELDGEIHGMGDEISKRQKDVERDSDYSTNGYKLIILNKQLTNDYQTNEIIKLFEQRGLKRIGIS